MIDNQIRLPPIQEWRQIGWRQREGEGRRGKEREGEGRRGKDGGKKNESKR